MGVIESSIIGKIRIAASGYENITEILLLNQNESEYHFLIKEIELGVILTEDFRDDKKNLFVNEINCIPTLKKFRISFFKKNTFKKKNEVLYQRFPH